MLLRSMTEPVRNHGDHGGAIVCRTSTAVDPLTVDRGIIDVNCVIFVHCPLKLVYVYVRVYIRVSFISGPTLM